MKLFLKILPTNWINLLGIFTCVMFYSIIFEYINSSNNIFQSIIASLIVIVLYGMIFLGGFLISLLLDIFIIYINKKRNLKNMLILEWLIISAPFFLVNKI